MGVEEMNKKYESLPPEEFIENLKNSPMYFSQMHTSAWLLGQTNSSWILMGAKTEQRAVIGQV